MAWSTRANHAHAAERETDPLLAALRELMLDVWADSTEPEAQPS
jgi:hypothetical protein